MKFKIDFTIFNNFLNIFNRFFKNLIFIFKRVFHFNIIFKIEVIIFNFLTIYNLFWIWLFSIFYQFHYFLQNFIFFIQIINVIRYNKITYVFSFHRFNEQLFHFLKFFWCWNFQKKIFAKIKRKFSHYFSCNFIFLLQNAICNFSIQPAWQNIQILWILFQIFIFYFISFPWKLFKRNRR